MGMISKLLVKMTRNCRNAEIAEQGFKLSRQQITREAQIARVSGTRTDKAMDYVTYKNAHNYGNYYSNSEKKQLAELYKQSKILGHFGLIHTWAAKNGRNFMAARERGRISAKRRC